MITFGISLVKWEFRHFPLCCFKLPENSLKKLGDEAENYVLNNWTAPSQLAQTQKTKLLNNI